jgi:hypothetical protein
MAFGIYLPFSTVGKHLGMVPLPPAYFIWLAGILLSYCLLTQLVKRSTSGALDSGCKVRTCTDEGASRAHDV